MYVLDDIINFLGALAGSRQQERAAVRAMGIQRDVYRDQQGSAASAYAQQRADADNFYSQARLDQSPYMEAGQSTLADMLSQMKSGGFDTQYRQLDPSQVANDPGFQFRMAEGQKALERSAAARGGLNSGGFTKGLAQYSQGLASTEYQNAWGRNQAENAFRQNEAQNRFGRMSSVAGMGQGSAQNLGALGAHYAGLLGQYAGANADRLGQYGSHYADSMSGLYGALGNAQAAGAVGMANAGAGLFRSIPNLATLGKLPTQGGG